MTTLCDQALDALLKRLHLANTRRAWRELTRRGTRGVELSGFPRLGGLRRNRASSTDTIGAPGASRPFSASEDDRRFQLRAVPRDVKRARCAGGPRPASDSPLHINHHASSQVSRSGLAQVGGGLSKSGGRQASRAVRFIWRSISMYAWVVFDARVSEPAARGDTVSPMTSVTSIAIWAPLRERRVSSRRPSGAPS